jgi:hypothetical protein
VTGGFLSQLDARGQAQLGVDVREVRLHSVRRNEETFGDALVGQSLADEPNDIALGRCQRRPTARRPFALTATPLGIRDRLFDGHRGSFGPSGLPVQFDCGY